VSIVSAKETRTNTEQCDSYGLWFEFLHPSAGGRDLCSVCIRLEGENRAAPLHLITRREAFRG
jgi:hypothetical protein